MFALDVLTTKEFGGKKIHGTAKTTFKIRIKPRKIYIYIHQNFSYSKIQNSGSY